VSGINNAVLSELLTDIAVVEAVHYREPINPQKVHFAAQLIDNSGIVEQLEEWEREDRAGKQPGGRPGMVSIRAALILLLLLARENSPMLVSKMEELLSSRLPRNARLQQHLILAGSPRARYHQLWRTLQRVRNLLDPYPMPRRNLLTEAQWIEVKDARNPDDAEKKQLRLNWFANQLLETTAQTVPAQYRKWSGNIVVDATLVASPAKGRSPEWGHMSSDPDAAWYVREGDHRDRSVGRNQKRSVKRVWGYEAEILLQFRNKEGEKEFPALAIGVAFHKPGVKPAEEAIIALSSIRDRGHPAGYLVGDRLYAPGSKADVYQLPARRLGYDLVMDYKKTMLGAQGGSHEGMIQVEGSYYSPSMPQSLRDATIHYRTDKSIDKKTWRERINARTAYLFRPKEKPNTDGSVPMMCPAVGPGATLDCPIKNLLLTRKTPSSRVPMRMPVFEHPAPEDQGKACTNKSSVTVPMNYGAKYHQSIQFGTKAWRKVYTHARNRIEGFNAYVKHEPSFALASRGRRMVRGYTAQYIVTAFLLAAANLRIIEDFLLSKRDPETTLVPSDTIAGTTAMLGLLEAVANPPGIWPPDNPR